jgi:hypothetical protein
MAELNRFEEIMSTDRIATPGVTVSLGFGTSIEIPPPITGVHILHVKKNKKKNYPEAPPALTITQVDGVEIKVERLPIRYESLEEIFDELPEFVQTLLADRISHEA